MSTKEKQFMTTGLPITAVDLKLFSSGKKTNQPTKRWNIDQMYNKCEQEDK